MAARSAHLLQQDASPWEPPDEAHRLAAPLDASELFRRLSQALPPDDQQMPRRPASLPESQALMQQRARQASSVQALPQAAVQLLPGAAAQPRESQVSRPEHQGVRLQLQALPEPPARPASLPSPLALRLRVPAQASQPEPRGAPTALPSLRLPSLSSPPRRPLQLQRARGNAFARAPHARCRSSSSGSSSL